MNRLTGTFVLGIFLAGLTPPALWAEPKVVPSTISAAPATTLAVPETTAESPTQNIKATAEAEAAPQIVLAKAETTITPEKGGTLTLGAMSVEIPAGAVDSTITVSVEELGTVQTMNPGLQNATARVAGYRLLPHRTFGGWVKLSLPYDQSLADSPAAREALEAYFYDDEARVWTKIRKTGVDEKRGVVEGVTSHFTDFITGTLKLPDSPKPLGFNPTSIKDIKAADPGAGVPQIDGLKPGPEGSADFNIPLRLPAGRAGIGPELSLSYHSGGGSGWLGTGFDIGVPSIRIDTRFHLPSFDGNDLYSFQGQDLTKTADGTVTSFVPRVEGPFSLIGRMAGSGHQYQWLVTEKTGKVSTYGGRTDAVAGPATSQDYAWYLSHVEDTHGNWMEWHYTADNGHVYPASINYTGYGTDQGAYRVVFENETRTDRRTDDRGGFVDKMALRLKDIQVYYTGGGASTLIRKYVFEYGVTTFGKSILTGYHEEDGSGAVFYRYGFEHYSVPIDSNGKVLGLQDAKSWGTGHGDFDASFSTNFSAGASLSGGLESPVNFEIGANASFGGNTGYESAKMLDLNGDGIPDIIEHGLKNEGLYAGSPSGGFSAVTNSGVPWGDLNSPNSQQDNTSFGLFASGGGFGFSASGSYSKSWEKSRTEWSYMDIDGDGKVDIVGPSGYYYKNTSAGGTVSFAKTSYGSASTAATAQAIDPEILQQYHYLDPLRLWSAWRPGTVDAQTVVSSSSTDTSWDGVKTWLYSSVSGSLTTAGTATLVANASGNETQTVSATGVAVGPGDHFTFRLSSGATVADDQVGWRSIVHYRSIRLFDDLTNERYFYWPTGFATTTSGGSTTGTSLPSNLSPYYNYNTSTFNNVTTETWTSKNSSLTDPTARQRLADDGYFVYRKLSMADYAAFGTATFVDTKTGQATTTNKLSIYYTFDPVSGKMILDPPYVADQPSLRDIHDTMKANNFTGYASTVSFPQGIAGTVAPLTGVLSSSQTQSAAVSSSVGTTSLGYLDPATKHVLAERTHAASGDQTVSLRAYKSLRAWHLDVRQDTPAFAGTDTWPDGRALTIADTNTISSNGTGHLDFTLAASQGQQRSFTLGYGLPASLDRDTVWLAWGSALQNTLSTTQGTAMLAVADAARLQTDWVPTYSAYNLNSGLSTAEQGYVVWAAVADGLLSFPQQLVNAQYDQVVAALSVSDQALWAAAYPADVSGTTHTIAGTLTAAQAQTAAVGAVLLGLLAAPATLTPTQYSQVFSLASVDAPRVQGDYTGVLSGYSVPTTLAAAESAYVLWAESLAGGVLVQDFGMTANSAGGYDAEANAYLNTVFTTGVDQASLYIMTNVAETIGFDSTTTFAVVSQSVSGTVTEYGFGTKSVQGSTDAVLLAHFVSGAVQYDPVYVHVFDSATDTNSTDPFAGLSNLRLPPENVLRSFGGGGYGWFYAEWNGNLDYDESKIQTFQSMADQKANDQNSVSNDDMLAAQAIWKMNWSDGAPFNGVWHGSVTSKSLTAWNSDTKSMTSTTTFEYSFITGDQARPYRVGGDTGIATASTSDLASGGGLSWIRNSQSSSASYSLGAGTPIGGLSSSYTAGSSSGDYDILDMNGDGRPDLVKKNGTVYLNTGNGFSATAASWNFSGIRNYDNSGLTLSGSISSGGSVAFKDFLSPSGKSSGTQADPGSSSKVDVSMGLGNSFSLGASYKSLDMMDVNGDGLPDQVSASGSSIVARINNGHGFGPTMTLNIPSAAKNVLLSDISKHYGALSGINNLVSKLNPSSPTQVLSYSGSTTSAVSVSLGGDYDPMKGLESLGNSLGISASAGGSVSASTTRTYFDFIDLNGDGQPDLVYKDLGSGQMKVCFNLGDSFADPVVWGSSTAWSANLTPLYYDPVTNTTKTATPSGNIPTGAESPWALSEEISSNTNISSSVNGGLNFRFYFPFIIAFPFFAIYFKPFVGIGVNGSLGASTASVQVSLADVDGDGLPDSVFNIGGNIMVRLNQSGTDGLLKRIITPEGGAVDLTYARVGNTPSDPHSHWVLSGVARTNWNTDAVASSDAAALPTQTMATNFTYASGNYDRTDRRFWGFGTVTATRADGVATTTTYTNNDYFMRERPKTVSTYDAQGTLIERQTTTDGTVAQTVANGAASSYWVKTTSTLNESFDNGTSLTSETRYAGYDSYGNPTRVEEYRGGALRRVIKIAYQSPGSHYLASLPTSLEVDGNSSDVLRIRTGSYDSVGNLTRQDSQYSSGRTLSTTLAWDSYGNLTSETDNAGYKLDYTYDPVLHALVTDVADSLNQTTSWTYDYAQGVELSQTDTNSQVITKTYDSFGRMVTVRSPYDTGSIPALSFSYDQSSYPWKAVTQNKVNYDPSDSQTIATVVMADGLGRMLQTKKQSVVTDPATGTGTLGWTVSPWVVYDDEGRESQKGTPTFESSSGHTSVYMAPVKAVFSGSDLYTQTTYDGRDRVIDTRLPDGAHQSTSYVLDQFNQQTAWKITSTDPAGRQKRVWKDPDELIVAVVQDPAGQALTSKFTYDGIGQMLTAADANGNATSVVYDQLGRKTSLNSPDSGLTVWEYDSNGDLTRKTDALLRSKTLSITYSYSQHRINQITYPDSTQTYSYGTDASQYNVGRVIAVANDRVTTTTSYGKLGETVGTKRLIKTRLAGDPDYQMTLGYAWNYQGQMTDVTYPDGEILHYGYDAGGQVTTITGTHLTVSFPYVNAIGYDEYGQRVRMDLGNGAKTVYTYDPARRWLKEALTTDGLNTVLQDLKYTFDTSGDVTTLSNTSAKKTTVQNYNYDALDQLTAANGSYQNNTFSLANTTTYHQSFAYDSIGNLTSKVSALTRSPATSLDGLLNYNLSYTYDPAHPHQANHIGNQHYVYDANGNLTRIVPDWAWTGQNSDPKTVIVTTKSTGRDVLNQAIGEDRSTTVTSAQNGTRFLTWDWENRLRAVKDDLTSVTYDYDADGERRLKTLGNTETVYADRMYELENGTGRTLATVNVYLGDTRLVSKVVPTDGQITSYEQQNTYYYHADHIGNSTLVTDYQAREYERLNFTPHGEVWQEDSLDTLDKIDFLFTGKQMDAETGWYNFGKRYLDPKTGLWLSADPALGEYLPNAPLTDDDKKHNQNLPGNGGVYNAINFALYHFAGNNPIRYTDPDGQVDEGLLKAAGTLAAATLAEDAVTGGAGVVDDPFTLGAAGLMALLALASTSNSSQTKATAMTEFSAAAAVSRSSGQIFYRGLSKADMKEYSISGMVSAGGVRTLGIFASRNELLSKSLDNVGQSHAYGDDMSPVISLTTNPLFAAEAATHDLGGDSSGMVAIIRTNRALPNPMGFDRESEWLVPLTILPYEIIDVVPASSLTAGGMLSD